MTIEEKQTLKVFLCHASGDKPQVRLLYKQLRNEGIDAWLDQEKLLPGQDWRVEIPRAVQEADVVIVCLSNNSTTKEGYIQKEIKFALDSADEKPDGTIFLIPARLEDCTVPEKLSRWQWVDLFEEAGYKKLLSSLQLRAGKLGKIVDSTYQQSHDVELENRLDQYYTEGLAAFYTEEWDKACQRFQAILRERPNYKIAVEKLEEAELQRDLANLYAQSVETYTNRNWQTAIKTLEELAKKFPGYKDSAQLLNNAKKQKQVNDLYAEAQKLHAAKKWLAVVKVFEQIALIDPNYSDPQELFPSAQKEAAELKRLAELNELYGRAVREMDSGKWGEAREILEQVHKAQTGFLETERLLKKAEAEIQKIEEKRKRINLANTYYEQAHGLVRSGSWHKAMEKLDEIQKLDSLFEDKDGIAARIRTELEREEQEAQKQNQLAAMYADAVRLLKEEKYLESLKKWQDVTAIDPKYPDRQWIVKTAQKKILGKSPLKPALRWRNIVVSAAIAVTAMASIYLYINSTYYDRFNDKTFDDAIDNNLWNPVASPPSYVKQQDGMLALSVGATRSIASAYMDKDLKLDQYYSVESKVLLSSNKPGTNGDAGIFIETLDKYGGSVNFTCVISRYETVQMWCEVFGRTDGAEYSTEHITTEYDVWHTFRIEIDPEVNATFYIDGKQMGSYKAADSNDLTNQNFTVSLRTWTPTETLEAFYDDVKFRQHK